MWTGQASKQVTGGHWRFLQNSSILSFFFLRSSDVFKLMLLDLNVMIIHVYKCTHCAKTYRQVEMDEQVSAENNNQLAVSESLQ